jgi:hypothetical protein
MTSPWVWRFRVAMLALGWFMVIRNIVRILSGRYPLTLLPIALHVTLTLCVAVLSWLMGTEMDRRRRERRRKRDTEPLPPEGLTSEDIEWLNEQRIMAGQKPWAAPMTFSDVMKATSPAAAEQLARRLIVGPPPLSEVGRHYVDERSFGSLEITRHYMDGDRETRTWAP